MESKGTVTHQPAGKSRDIGLRRECGNAFRCGFEVENGGARNTEDNLVFFEISGCDWEILALEQHRSIEIAQRNIPQEPISYPGIHRTGGEKDDRQ